MSEHLRYLIIKIKISDNNSALSASLRELFSQLTNELSGNPELNRGPLGPEPSALPSALLPVKKSRHLNVTIMKF